MTTNDAGSAGVPAADVRSYAEYAAQFKTARSSTVYPLVGLLISLLADVLAIAAADPGASRSNDILYVLAAVAALTGLFVRSSQRPLDCFVLGVWLLAVPSLIGELMFAAAAHATGRTLDLRVASDVTGTVAVAFLFAALARSADRGGWRSPLGLSVSFFLSVLIGTTVYLGWLINLVYVIIQNNSWNTPGTPRWNSFHMATLAFAVVAFVVAMLLAANALRLHSRLMGGAALLGWLAAPVLGNLFGFSHIIPVAYYLSHYLGGGSFPYRDDYGLTVVGNDPAFIWQTVFVFLSALLAFAYAMRKDRIPRKVNQWNQ